MNSISKNLALSLFFFIQIVSISFGQNTDSGTTNNAESESLKVLFIGNSYSNYNDLHDIFTEIANGSNSKIRFEAKEVVKNSFSLSRHFNGGETLEVVRNGNWDYVVLQEQSIRPITNPKAFYEYVGKFNKEIKKAGAQTILFMTWAKKEKPETIKQISEAYLKAGENQNIKVAPVGLAWESCRKDYPQIELYRNDGSHPTLEGSYIAACIFYSAITNQKPERLLSKIDKETAFILQNIAWNTFEQLDKKIALPSD